MLLKCRPIPHLANYKCLLLCLVVSIILIVNCVKEVLYMLVDDFFSFFFLQINASNKKKIYWSGFCAVCYCTLHRHSWRDLILRVVGLQIIILNIRNNNSFVYLGKQHHIHRSLKTNNNGHQQMAAVECNCCVKCKPSIVSQQHAKQTL